MHTITLLEHARDGVQNNALPKEDKFSTNAKVLQLLCLGTYSLVSGNLVLFPRGMIDTNVNRGRIQDFGAREGADLRRGVQIGGGEVCALPREARKLSEKTTISILKNAQNNHIYNIWGL